MLTPRRVWHVVPTCGRLLPGPCRSPPAQPLGGLEGGSERRSTLCRVLGFQAAYGRVLFVEFFGPVLEDLKLFVIQPREIIHGILFLEGHLRQGSTAIPTRQMMVPAARAIEIRTTFVHVKDSTFDRYEQRMPGVVAIVLK